MSDPSRPRAGGVLLALAILIGTVAGGLRGQPTIGLLAGFGIGVVAAILVWLADRRRRP